MAINFAAENMQGYNYPNISVLTTEMSSAGELVSYPSFDDIMRLISQGVVPFMVVRLPGVDGAIGTELILMISQITTDTIYFGSFGALDTNTGLIFRRGQAPEVK